MTQDEIIEMAQQCGLIGMRPHLDGIYSEALEAFAKLVRNDYSNKHAQLWLKRIDEAVKAEREACAKECDKRGYNSAADVIRERGEQQSCDKHD
jgi:hypothetical protein